MTSVVYGNEGAAFEPASIDIHNAVCAEFVDQGIQEGPYGPKHNGVLVFQVEETVDAPDTDWHGRRKEVRHFFTMTLGSKSYPSKLRKLIEKWRGRPITDEEQAEGFDIEKLVGQPCRLDISHKISKNDRTYAVVDSITKAGKTKLTVSDNYVPLAERGTQDGAEDSPSNDEEDDDVPF